MSKSTFSTQLLQLLLLNSFVTYIIVHKYMKKKCKHKTRKILSDNNKRRHFQTIDEYIVFNTFGTKPFFFAGRTMTRLITDRFLTPKLSYLSSQPIYEWTMTTFSITTIWPNSLSLELYHLWLCVYSILRYVWLRKWYLLLLRTQISEDILLLRKVGFFMQTSH